MNFRLDDSLALHTDLYQLNMGYTYWADGIHEKQAVFEVYFRKIPFNNGFAIFAGLERVIDYINNFKFTETDIAYIRENLNYEEEYVEYLKNMKFTGTIKAMREGELVFGNIPLLRVEAPLIQAQIVETAILNIINYQTLIATKAARIKEVAPDDTLMEFGTRRAQELDAAIWGTRAAYIAGFDSTSNVRAGKLFGIPISGTHAHSLIQTYEDEYTAFKAYAKKHKNCVFLVDTYDTLRSGVPNAIRVAKELGDSINFVGVRLDSGDLAYLSKKTRVMLDEAGFKDAKIVASNDLDEYTIIHLKRQGAKIDSWGIGTKLITAFDQAALGAVYKLVSIEEDGKMVDRIKISGNPEKVTTPGMKKVYRIINRDTGKSEGDYICMEDEFPENQSAIKLFHPVHTFLKKTITNFEAKELHVEVFKNGELVYQCPSIQEIRNFVQENLQVLWEEYRRNLNPAEYPVDLSQKCWDNKMNHIRNVKRRVLENSEE